MSRDVDKGGRLIIGGPARANLLPPEVGIAAKGRVMRRNAIGLIFLVVIAVIAAYAGATFLAIGAQVQLDAANNHTQELVAEQAKYSEVRSVTALLQTATEARKAATSTEIGWKDYLDDIQAILPAGTLVTNVVAETATPLTPFAQPSVPLQGDRIGVLTFTATSASLPDVEAWLQSLAKLNGYVDAAPGSVNLQADGTYQVNITMHISKDAYLLRFDEEAKAARDAAVKKAAEDKTAEEKAADKKASEEKAAEGSNAQDNSTENGSSDAPSDGTSEDGSDSSTDGGN